MSFSHRCGGILDHSSLQNCFNSATLEGFRVWMDCLRSCHSISIGFKSGIWLDHSPMDAVFAQSLSYCWIMNTDLNWSKWGLQFFRCCSGLFYDLLDELSLCSWSNFGRPATPGKVHHCSKFSPFVDNGSDRGSLESQSLRNGFITLSRTIHVNYFVFHLFLNFFRSQHDVMHFSMLHFVRQVQFKWFLDSRNQVIRPGYV